ncbi:MAG TPA: alpha/beta hydrolase [Myxococcota bacterium]|nr:alpha/beta hydrolase [Myxococcota bacterium]
MYQSNPGKRIRVGDIEMEYEEHGGGDRPFVLVHGFTGSRDDWKEHLPYLGKRGRTIAVDQRGHGGSTNTGDAATYRIEQLAADLAGFLDAVGAPEIDLLGHSMGGGVALRFVLQYPERVRSLILMDTLAGNIPGDAHKFLAIAAKIAREQGMEALYQLTRANGDGPATPPAVKRLIALDPEGYWARARAKNLAMDPVAFEALGTALATTEGVTDRLGEIACPTTVIVGAEDKPFLKPSETMATRIPGARKIVIEGGAHCPQVEAPEKWIAAVDAHLDWARGA